MKKNRNKNMERNRNMEKKVRVRIKYTNIFSMPVMVNRKVSAVELKELLQRDDVEVVSILDK